MQKNGNNIKVDYENDEINSNFLVRFNDSNNEYNVDRKGNITLKGNIVIKELGIDDYIKDGLILWYDGIKNTRSGNNPNATSVKKWLPI